jgi:hypothetical protein
MAEVLPLQHVKKMHPYDSNTPIINWMIKQEDDMGLDTPKPYREFEERVYFGIGKI